MPDQRFIGTFEEKSVPSSELPRGVESSAVGLQIELDFPEGIGYHNKQ
jgi:hypothetical protein